MGTSDWQREADRLAGAHLSEGDATGWFELLWSRGRDGVVTMPWDSGLAQPLLTDWMRARAAVAGERAVVVGCGLGADAELVAAAGFDTVGFDVSPTAIALAQQRHRSSSVAYTVADLLSLPGDWSHAFDLVVDVYTVQALPVSLRPEVSAAVAQLVAPGGSLLVVSFAQDGDRLAAGPPWPLSSSDIHAFEAHGLEAIETEQHTLEEHPGARYWRAEFARPQ